MTLDDEIKNRGLLEVGDVSDRQHFISRHDFESALTLIPLRCLNGRKVSEVHRNFRPYGEFVTALFRNEIATIKGDTSAIKSEACKSE